jgi:hypothetical protein
MWVELSLGLNVGRLNIKALLWTVSNNPSAFPIKSWNKSSKACTFFSMRRVNVYKFKIDDSSEIFKTIRGSSSN